MVQKFIQEEDGATIIEYGLIGALLVVIGIAAIFLTLLLIIMFQAAF